jgi:hypothetical protein
MWVGKERSRMPGGTTQEQQRLLLLLLLQQRLSCWRRSI